jgi:hypothetical protein
MTSWTESSSTLSRGPRRRTWSHLSSLCGTCSKLKSLTSTCQPQMSSHSFCTYQWSPTQICSTFMSSCHYQSTSILLETFQSLQTSVLQICSRLATHNLFKLFPALKYTLASNLETPSFATYNLFKLFPAQTYTLASTLGTPSFAKEGKSWKRA